MTRTIRAQLPAALLRGGRDHVMRDASGGATRAGPSAGLDGAPSADGTSRAARNLALAHHVERLVEAGMIESYAEASRALGLTRARLSQLMNLLLLDPAIQEAVLVGDGATSEHQLRPLVAKACWEEQRRLNDAERD